MREKAISRYDSKKYIKEEVEHFYEMANIRPDKTGLKMVIWIFPESGKEKHWARIKVSTHYGNKISNDLFTVTVEDEPKVIGKTGEIKSKDIEDIISFVKNNKITLLKVWKDEIDPVDAVKEFKK